MELADDGQILCLNKEIFLFSKQLENILATFVTLNI